MYQKRKEKLVKILELIGECLKEDIFLNEEKARFFNMITELLGMLMIV